MAMMLLASTRAQVNFNLNFLGFVTVLRPISKTIPRRNFEQTTHEWIWMPEDF